jgi:hypothetical protein
MFTKIWPKTEEIALDTQARTREKYKMEVKETGCGPDSAGSEQGPLENVSERHD